MTELRKCDLWEAVFIPNNAMKRLFNSERTGKPLCEIVLPDKLPEGTPEVAGWHFFMPATCLRETRDGKSFRIIFPPSWTTIRVLSPYVKGQRPNSVEFPIEDGLAFLRDVFEK